MKLTVSTFIVPAMVLATLAKGVLLSSTVPRLADDLEERPHHHPRALDAMGVGSSCASSEGAWFCMSSSFQRCASGQWSAVMQCAQGTVCQPEGLTYDPQSSSLLSSSPSSSSSPPTPASTSAFGIVPVMTTSTPTAVVAPTWLTTTMTSSGFASGGETTEKSSSETTATTASASTTEQATTTMTTTSCSAGLSTTSCTTSTETSTAHATESTGAPKNNTSGASRVIGMGLSWSLVGLACAASLTGGRAFPL